MLRSSGMFLLAALLSCGARTGLAEPTSGPDASTDDASTDDASTDAPAPDQWAPDVHTVDVLPDVVDAQAEADAAPLETRLWSGGSDGYHSCAIREGGSLWCWGNNYDGQLGSGDPNPFVEVPAQVKLVPVGVVALGASHTCAAREGETWCWGDNSQGQLGTGSTQDQPAPVQVLLKGSSSLASSALSLGGHHTCSAVASLHCWGANDSGQLGIGGVGGFKDKPEIIPLPDSDPMSPLTLGAGHRHTCAIGHLDMVMCWGDNEYGQLGLGNSGGQTTPQWAHFPTPATGVAAGMRHTCAMTVEGHVFCAGEGGYGQLGYGSWDASSEPVQAALPELAAQLVAGGAHTCIRTATDRVYCWGLNGHGQLGVSSMQAMSSWPEQVPIEHVVDLAAGAEHTCALRSDRSVWCWGSNENGQLGNGSTLDAYTPVPVTGLP